MLELKHTQELMVSQYYKERFIAEYAQLKIRYVKLKSFCQRIEVAQLTGAEEPKHDCPLELLRKQLNVMHDYLEILEMRAKIEHINLDDLEQRLTTKLPEEPNPFTKNTNNNITNNPNSLTLNDELNKAITKEDNVGKKLDITYDNK